MTIQWRCTARDRVCVLSLAGYLGPEEADRLGGAVGWALARGRGPVVLDLTALDGWSAAGRLAIAEAARQLAAQGRSLELAAIPADGSLVPDGMCPPIPVHHDLDAALATHNASADGPGARREWRTVNWPGDTQPVLS
ncbi:STAS domain-containing protein [Streptomyces inhibens]|uniref:STAS domain-containing protein n=1 Tax=Streptomyces inhibens TaxID=2293571 RepID=UPI001EE77AD9|nr:STAS domain-containing protein [Streptomyces inhibens]UKY48553.1 STAS domain-containing protein [Streptomyces inhibens]